MMEKTIALYSKVPFSRNHILALFQAGIFLFSLTRERSGFHPPPENNVTIELGQGNLAHNCVFLKATPMPNLVVIAQSMVSLMTSSLSVRQLC